MSQTVNEEEVITLRLNMDRIKVWIYLIVVPLIIIGLGISLYLDRRSSNQRVERLAKINAGQIAVNAAQVKRLRAALSEVCHTNVVMSNVIGQMIIYIQSAPGSNTQAAQNAISGLSFFGQDLGQQTACLNIQRP